MMYFFNSGKDKMLLDGDFDLNSAQIYTESHKEVFKQTMLNQDIIFRNQVYELHRLYSVQKTLAKDLGKYDSWKAGTVSSLTSIVNPRKFEPPEKVTENYSISMVDALQPTSLQLFERHQGKRPKLQQMPLDLQLPADQYINHVVENLPSKGSVWDPLKETMELSNSFCGGHFQDKVELKLSLSLGADDRTTKGTKRTWHDKKTQPYSHTVIDLEEPTERILNEDEELAASLSCTAPTTCFGGKHECQVFVLSDPCISRNVKKYPSRGIAEGSSLVDDCQCCQKRDSFNQGFKGCNDGITCNNLSTWKQLYVSYKPGGVDLNEVQLDDLSFYSHDLMVANPSTASSLGGFSEPVGRVQEGFFPTMVSSIEISDTLQQDNAANFELTNSSCKDKRTEIWTRNSKLSSETEVNQIGLKSVSRPQIELCEDLNSHSSNSKNRKDESMLELKGIVLQGPGHTYVENRQVICEKSEVEDAALLCFDQSQNIEGKDGDRSPSCKSCCITDNDLTSVKIMQLGIESGNSSLHASDQFSGMQVGSQVTEVLSDEQDQRSFGNSESKEEWCKKKVDSDEVDGLIQRAAESLIHISSYNSACYQDSSTQAGSNEMGSEEMDLPQLSCDSFELITLKLPETNADDFCVSSKTFEINNTENKDFSLKLRRGRRMKDFQKDILPGLASLSRHEIREDINILEGVLRSREYRKIRASMTDGGSWCAPVKSRRSRRNNARRRNFK